MIEVKAYECEHCCNKVLRTKNGMRSHESKCFFNEKTKSCVTCDYFVGDDRECKAKQDIEVKLKHNCINWKQQERTEEDIQLLIF